MGNPLRGFPAANAFRSATKPCEASQEVTALLAGQVTKVLLGRRKSEETRITEYDNAPRDSHRPGVHLGQEITLHGEAIT